MARIFGSYPNSDEGSRHLVRLFEGTPIELRWFGWQTTTHSLHREGWEILANEWTDAFTYGHCVQIGVKSPDGKMLITGRVSFDMRDIVHQGAAYWMRIEDIYRRGHVQMECYTHKDTVRTLPAIDLGYIEGMRAIDPFSPVDIPEWSLRRDWQTLRVFDYIGEDKTKKIFIPQERVEDYLDKILQLQYPEQQKMKKLITPDHRIQKVEAQIIALAS